MRHGLAAALAALVALAAGACASRRADADWPAYGRDEGGTRSLDGDITPANVSRLTVAWTYHTGENTFETEAEAKSAFEATPIAVDGLLVLSTPFGRIIALDAATGRERWRFDPRIPRDAGYSEVTSRGVSTWLDRSARAGAPCRRRIFLGTIDARLIAVDAADGQPCRGFGQGGTVALANGVGSVRPGQYQVTSPPAILDGLVVVGSSIGDNGGVELERGRVRAFDARTGALAWSWDPLPPDRPTGAANAWGVLSVDPARGLVFVPTSSPSPDYFGGRRPGGNADANSVVALRAATGERVWAFQVVHHDLWDYDVAAQPLLLPFPQGGRSIDAVAVATKIGHVFFLDRETGAPLVPVDERPVSASDVAGEEAWPTQPFPRWPPPLVPQRLRAEDAWGVTAADRDACRQAIGALRSEGLFTPPSLRGTIVLPSNVGGTNWGGMAYDEKRRVLVTAVNNLPVAVRLIPREKYSEERQRAQDSRLTGEFAPMRDTPYGMHRAPLLSPSGVPCNPPPWGMLVALDLEARTVRWKVPLGAIPRLASVPGHERFGSINLGGPIVTGGVVFAAAAMDETLRAFDLADGRLLWQHALPASAQATPMTYRVGGRQYVVIAAGGHGKLGTRRGDAVVAFALAE